MPKITRFDGPGTWHHVGNRALSKRPMFEGRADVRRFLALLARIVRAGLFEVHSFVAVTNHFHLLVRSYGKLSEAMQRLQNGYARAFNRRVGRDGSLVRQRFWSVPANDLVYRRAVVRYVDYNSVKAGMASRADQYPFGSAIHYATRRRGPPWLTREWVEGIVAARSGGACGTPAAYFLAFPEKGAPEIASVIESRGTQHPHVADPIDAVLNGPPSRIRDLFNRRVLRADGRLKPCPLVAASTILRFIRLAEAKRGPWELHWGRKGRDGWHVALVALLRDLAGAGFAEIAATCGTAVSTAHRTYRQHSERITQGGNYAARLAWMARALLLQLYG